MRINCFKTNEKFPKITTYYFKMNNKNILLDYGVRLDNKEFINSLGCDRIAHRACIDVNGDTIAVLPSSCDNPQPISNKKLAQEIVANGGLLISEYASGEKIGKYNFPRRDRIQSLLSNVVLVIEASDNSGTMNAVKKSLDDNKKVYAIEGNHISLIENYVNANDEYQLKVIENNIK